jgi:hypothetical protein
VAVAMAYELKSGSPGVFVPPTSREGRTRRRERGGRGEAASGLPLERLIDEFLEAVKRGSARDRYGRPFTRSAIRELRWCLDGHVREELGAMRVREVRRDDVEALVYKLGDAGISRRRLRAVTKSVRALFDYAAEQRLVRQNPAERIALPDEAEAEQPTGRTARQRTTVDRAISLALQLATLAFAVITLILIAESL